MKNTRRLFLKWSGILGLGLMNRNKTFGQNDNNSLSEVEGNNDAPFILSPAEKRKTVIGEYGNWANGIMKGKLPSHSFRKDEWSDLNSWKNKASKIVNERIAAPDLGGIPKVKVDKKYLYDGLLIEEISWQLPTGGRSEGIVLKPANARGRLPGILAFHDHGGWKYFGKRKITRTSDERHPMMVDHQNMYYDDLAWANEVAKRGYVVLVPDAFPFASRRVLLKDVPENLKKGLSDENPELPENAAAYNKWAAWHEDTMAKSLFSAGTSWPGVFFAEDRKALDILCERDDVLPDNIGCGGLSGGGMRTVFMGGLDPRIKCAICAGFMTTWKDMALYKSFTHTWMTFVPGLPAVLDFPEILGLRVPLPTMVLNSIDDGLYSLDEMHVADKMLSEVYEKAGAMDRYKCTFYPGGHQFNKNMQDHAFEWFDKWLK
jgi:dienelactone hydrolase